MNNAEILAKSLLDLGVDRIFGFSGATILPVFHALGATEIELTVCANEQACAFAASGYSRAAEKIGITVVTSGPAITNTLTAVADAHADSVPMLVFAGQVAQTKMDTDEFQHINVKSVFADAAKKVVLVNEMQRIEEVVKDAYFYAKSGKPGPVVIDFPYDIQMAEGEYQGISIDKFRRKYDEERHLGENQCQQFFELLQNAKKPLLYIGGGLNSRAGSEKIRAFNRRFAVPSINSLMGKGVLDETAVWAMGMLGMFGVPAANKAIQETDLFVAFGVRWDDRVSEKVGDSSLAADIAYFDINPLKVQEVRFTRDPKFSFIGKAETALDDLLNYAEKHDIQLDIGAWQAQAKQLKQGHPLDYNRKAEEIQQAEVMEQLAGLITANTKVTTGVGNHQMLAAQHLTMFKPKSFLTAGGFGPMGYALPAAIGAYHAAPDATIISIDGDGSLLMNLGELFSIGRYQLPIKVLLLNNHGDGMVRNIQDFLYQGDHVATKKDSRVNFANVAKELGFPFHRRVEERSQLQSGLAAFMAADGPSFLEIVCDRQEILYPRIPAGKGYQNMVLGPYMEKQEEQ
ncbi:thiamine pyrophosphate-binding protein [Desulfogranum mediterraneum]|uniref:thiamine pyrophosphate-binding protein n=1 Tax=Desulfogranum mediterraneum TaxID=160661 RepID=UPI0003F76000|nr:thiamine pyrophosphate-binding protein [Desulfogranum mediterraneum]